MFGIRNSRPVRIAGLTTVMLGIGLFLASGAVAAETGNPDGKIGRPAFGLAAAYASATGRGNFWVRDFQDISGCMSMPLSAQATGSIFGLWHKQDSVRYSFGVASRLYFFNSESSPHSNPDGQLGRPVIDLELGVRTSSDPNQKPKAIGALKLLFPYSDHLTFQASYRYYQAIQVQDAESFAASITYYGSPLVVDSFLINPDGPIGHPIYTLRGGASKSGGFFELEIGCPLNRQLSFAFNGRAEFLESPYNHNLIAGLRLKWFAI